MQLDSTDVTAADRQRMAQAVWQNREKFDGFVLTHGTDTLAYTAALLTHLLPHFDKPLVLTGSMLPMGVPDSMRRAICWMRSALRQTDAQACTP